MHILAAIIIGLGTLTGSLLEAKEDFTQDISLSEKDPFIQGISLKIREIIENTENVPGLL